MRKVWLRKPVKRRKSQISDGVNRQMRSVNLLSPGCQMKTCGCLSDGSIRSATLFCDMTVYPDIKQQIYYVKAVPYTPLDKLDLNRAEDEEFSPDKLRATLERFYMTVVV